MSTLVHGVKKGHGHSHGDPKEQLAVSSSFDTVTQIKTYSCADCGVFARFQEGTQADGLPVRTALSVK